MKQQLEKKIYLEYFRTMNYFFTIALFWYTFTT